MTDAQLQVSAVPGSRFKFRPSQLAGAGTVAAAAATPSLSAGSGYGAAAAAGRAGSSAGGLGLGGLAGSASKLTASLSRQQPHTTLSFGGCSPQTVTPKQDYMLPPHQAAAASISTSRRL